MGGGGWGSVHLQVFDHAPSNVAWDDHAAWESVIGSQSPAIGESKVNIHIFEIRYYISFDRVCTAQLLASLCCM